MGKSKKYYTDLGLMAAAPAALVSGLAVHLAGHGIIGTNAKLLIGIHLFFGAALLVLSIIHIEAHWGWYKSLTRSFRGHDKAALLLSAAFIVMAVTGIVLTLQQSDPGTRMSIIHYKAGIVFAVLALWHIIVRFARFRKLK